LKNILLAALAGLLYALAFPAYDLWPFACLFGLPLFFAVKDAPWREAFLYGLVAGIVAWGGLIYWVGYVVNIYGYLNLGVAAVVLLGLMAYLALYMGIFAAAAAGLLPTRLAVVSVPGIWVLMELFRSYALTGFPWGLLGYAFYPVKPLIQVAEFGGVYLISGLAMMVNLALYKLLQKDYKPLAAALALVAACLAWGGWRMHTVPAVGEALRVGIAQANIPQDQKWLEANIESTVARYEDLTRQAVRQGARIVAWPETACNFYLFLDWPPTLKVVALSQEVPARLLIGSPAVELGSPPRYFNRIWLLDKGLIMGSYDKVHLVPFGEYVPLARLLKPFVGKLTEGVSDFSTADAQARPIEDIGVLICFESLFPDMSRRLCRQGAAYLVNASNDAWFSTWSASRQLLAMSAFRSIETRRYLVRPVNHGISAVIDPKGRIVQSLGLLQEGVIVADIRKLTYQTFYTRFGPVIVWLWGLIGVALLARLWFDNRQR